MTPAAHPANTFRVRYNARNYVIGSVEHTETHTIVTDVWNGNQTKIHNSRVRAKEAVA